jgi:hypothetical protein
VLNLVSAVVLLVGCLATAPLAADAADGTVTQLVKQLDSIDSDERAAAAKSLREILAEDPSRRTNDHGRAYWEERVSQVTTGMSHDEVVKLLPPAEGVAPTWSVCSGSTCNYGWRLDDYWTIALGYQRRDDVPAPVNKNWLEGLEDRLAVVSLPTLKEWAVHRSPARPNDFTGTWATWHVNGQPFAEIESVNGKTHGESRHYFDNGALSYTQKYVDGVTHGVGLGWNREGKKLYEMAYADGKQSGTYTHWWSDGKLRSLGEYRDGKREGRHQRWDESGLLSSDEHYRNDKQHGESQSWNDEGKLNWSRKYRDGEVVLDRRVER